MSNPFRQHSEQYKWANRDFVNGDLVIFVGPPDEEFQSGMIVDPRKHALYGKQGQIRVGVSEDIRVYPDTGPDMLWVAFEGDRIPMRQVARSWLVRLEDFREITGG